MYKLLEDLELDRKPVTPRALKMYKELLLTEAKKLEDTDIENVSISDGLRATADTLDLFLDEDDVMKWADIIFFITDEQKDLLRKNIEDYNYEEFTRGFQDFLAKVSPIAVR